ncbi:MAG: Fe-S cluster assembly ATPase SufC [bacterium]
MLSVENLTISAGKKVILREMNLKIGEGEVHVLMGVNGSGKSSLANILLGNKNYVAEKGKVEFEGRDLLKMSVNERARTGIYVAWQNPITIPGVSVFNLCKASYEAMGHKINKLVDFKQKLEELAMGVGLTKEHVSRNVNEDFSGGEKKRLELLQLLLLKPRLAILDEVDSGLDAEGAKFLRGIIGKMRSEGTSFLVITHNQKLLEKITVTKIWKTIN